MMDIQGSVRTGLCTVDTNERRDFKQFQHQRIINDLKAFKQNQDDCVIDCIGWKKTEKPEQ